MFDQPLLPPFGEIFVPHSFFFVVSSVGLRASRLAISRHGRVAGVPCIIISVFPALNPFLRNLCEQCNFLFVVELSDGLGANVFQ